MWPLQSTWQTSVYSRLPRESGKYMNPLIKSIIYSEDILKPRPFSSCLLYFLFFFTLGGLLAI